MANKIFGIIGWIGTVLVFAAVAARLYTPPWGWWSDHYATYMAWAGLVAVLIYMAGQWRDVATFYKGRGAQYGTMSIVSILVFLGILVAVNYLGVRQNKRWDFTANQVYSLSDQTIKVLQTLDAPVTFVVFDRQTSFDAFRDRLDQFTYHSTNVKTEYVDPDREPTRAKEAAIQSYGTILIQYKDRTERVTSSDEQAITNALSKAVTGATRKVYFTQGHGEKDIAATDRTGLSTIVQALSSDNYGVESLVLVQQKTVPADATVVVIPGPTTDFFQPEIDALNTYVNAGGKVLVMLDPEAKSGANTHPLLTQFLADWGIRAGNDVVLDASGMGQMLGTDASVPVAAQYPPHAISEGFRLLTAYPMARSMTPIEGGANGRIAQPLVNTSTQSWAEADLASLSGTGGAQVAFDEGKGDRMGPITLGAAVSAPATAAPAAPAGNGTPASPDAERKPESRVVGIGDSDFAANFGLGIQGNRDFFMNAVNWLAQSENLIAIRPREPADRRLTLTADQQQRIMLLCLFVIPGIVFASGVYTWWRRR
ncbi:MAG: Gldg family protein [Acidobacteriota bacterium]|nr:Gldg family protein [Acidobacteriota bacterium]